MAGPTKTAPERLDLSPEQMRALGYQVVDLLVEHFTNPGERAVGRKATRAELEARLREPPPETPSDPITVFHRFSNEVRPHMLGVDHPRFFAFVPSPNNFVSAMADAIAAGLNVFNGTWFAGSGAAQVELVVTDWLRTFCEMPDTAGGLFVSGGSMANLTALAVARNVKLRGAISRGIVYLSDQTHSSVPRALNVLGFSPVQIRTLAADAGFRLPLDELAELVAQDRAAGLTPFCVVANAGTTNSGAVDPMAALASFCRAEQLWLHADGAYGAPAILTDEGKAQLRGLGEVDSLSLDPHKWLFQSFEAGCVLVRDRALLLDTFQVMPEYLRDTESGAAEVNFGNYGVQLTRSFRSLKLWMSMHTFGLGAFRSAIARGMDLARAAEAELRRASQWEVVTPAALGIVTFRYRPTAMEADEVDRLQGRIVEAMIADGFALATSTVLRGRPVLRLCTINPRTSEEEVVETIGRMAALGEGLARTP